MSRRALLVVSCLVPVVAAVPIALAAPAAPLPNAAVVNVVDSSFESKTIVLQLGKDGKATVDWRWSRQSMRPHNVQADNGSFNSHPGCSGGSGLYGAPTGLAKCGYTGVTTYKQTFTKPGVYRYHCAIHGGAGKGMAGSVVVKAAPVKRR